MSALVATPFRRAALATAICAVLALAALAIAATDHVSVRQFVLGAPNQQAVAVLKPHQSTCEGPVSASGAVNQVAILGASVIAINRVRVDVRDASSGAVLARGTFHTTTFPREYFAQLNTTVPGGRPVRVCLTSTLNSFSLLGSASVQPTVNMTHGVTPGLEYSLILLRSSHLSLLSSLSEAFGRAALWRPDWVGAWTFWLLLIAIVCGFGLVIVAVAGAASDDDERDDPDAQSGSNASTARQ